jgi:hypothetical protein
MLCNPSTKGVQIVGDIVVGSEAVRADRRWCARCTTSSPDFRIINRRTVLKKHALLLRQCYIPAVS